MDKGREQLRKLDLRRRKLNLSSFLANFKGNIETGVSLGLDEIIFILGRKSPGALSKVSHCGKFEMVLEFLIVYNEFYKGG